MNSTFSLYQLVLTGLAGILAPVLVSWFGLRGVLGGKEREARSAVQVKELDGEQQREGWRHDDYARLLAEHLALVKVAAKCEAEHNVLKAENAELKQKLVFAGIFSEAGHIDMEKLRRYVDKMEAERTLPPELPDDEP